jgi:hypothetical protein
MAEGRLTCGSPDGGDSENKIPAGRALGAAIVRHLLLWLRDRNLKQCISREESVSNAWIMFT